MSAGLKAENSETFKTMVQFECRGLEPVDFQPQVRIFVVLFPQLSIWTGGDKTQIVSSSMKPEPLSTRTVIQMLVDVGSFLSCMKKGFWWITFLPVYYNNVIKKSWGYNIWCHKHLERVIGQIWACFVEHMSSTPVLFACDSVSGFNPARTSFALSFMLCNEADAIYTIW